MISTQPNVNNKILANDLLRWPSTGLKIRATLNKKHCPWAKILQDLFTDMIENCCNACEEMYQESARRNTSANKSLRLSDFARGKSSSRPSTPRQTSSKSGLNLTAERNVECEVTDTDMLLMPPPLPLQVPTSELIVDENELNQQAKLSEAVQLVVIPL
ncbi:PREDICTED: uncharacterized protein LOC105365307 [Ceratosolen solmsi marchali]|uniref:Uncharacterized protein LOC105365307 n=1 Tax=Ceratosolen solmsi marchali TaxID=326594 RepID=A0AAJ7DZ50_9HYME|nr:PREDICTED: uncharacterized protein LOC105365307 [Ceratosolen solmsi marchali]